MTQKEYIKHREAFLTDPEVYYSSAIGPTLEHPEYKALVAGGRSILPYLLQDLEEGKDLSPREHTDKPRVWWAMFEAVRAIVGDAPEIPEESQGRLHEMQEIFAEWLESRI